METIFFKKKPLHPLKRIFNKNGGQKNMRVVPDCLVEYHPEISCRTIGKFDIPNALRLLPLSDLPHQFNFLWSCVRFLQAMPINVLLTSSINLNLSMTATAVELSTLYVDLITMQLLVVQFDRTAFYGQPWHVKKLAIFVSFILEISFKWSDFAHRHFFLFVLRTEKKWLKREISLPRSYRGKS